MKNKKAIIHLLPLILVGIIIAVAVGYFYFNQSSDTPLITQSSLSPESEVIDTSDWETYVNEGLGLKFEHPANWVVSLLPPKEIQEKLNAIGIPCEIFITTDIGSFIIIDVNTEESIGSPHCFSDNNLIGAYKNKFLPSNTANILLQKETDRNEEAMFEKMISTLEFTDENGLFESRYKKLIFKHSPDWKVEYPVLDGYESLLISRDGYKIISVTKEIDGGQCIYTDTKQENIMPIYVGSDPISEWVELDLANTTLRRSLAKNVNNFHIKGNDRKVFSFCMGDPNVKFVTFVFGETFYYDVPSDYNLSILKEMDEIVRTFRSNN